MYPRKAGWFLSEDWECYPSEAVSPLWKESIKKTDGMNGVCPFQQGLCFRAWQIHAGFTVHCLMIICKYLSLSHKLDYERSKSNTYHVVSLFQWVKQVFVLMQRKKFLGNNDERADQIAWRNEIIRLGFLKKI